MMGERALDGSESKSVTPQRPGVAQGVTLGEARRPTPHREPKPQAPQRAGVAQGVTLGEA